MSYRRELSDYHATIGSEDRCKPRQLDAIANESLQECSKQAAVPRPRRNELPRSGLVQSILLVAGNRIENTVRCFGIEVDEALALAEQVEV